jgi:hypothetical protein
MEKLKRVKLFEEFRLNEEAFDSKEFDGKVKLVNEGMTPVISRSTVKLVHIEIPNRESKSNFDKVLKMNIEEDDVEVIKSAVKKFLDGDGDSVSKDFKDGGYVNIVGFEGKKEKARLNIVSQYFTYHPVMTETDMEFLLHVLDGDNVQTALKKAKGESQGEKKSPTPPPPIPGKKNPTPPPPIPGKKNPPVYTSYPGKK